MFEKINVYCERTDFAFWGEPLNALTNIAFIIAAYFCYRLYRTSERIDFYALTLIMLLVYVGIGSFLFHTLAERWAALADIIPIGLLILTYYIAMMRRVFHVRWLVVAGLFGLFPIAYAGINTLPFLSATAFYFPALMMMIIFAAFYIILGKKEKQVLPFAAFIFVISLAARVADHKLCGAFPYGTHFIWHICNASVLYLAFRAYWLNANVKHSQ